RAFPFRRASSGWIRWWDGWRSLVSGLATFALSGLLGLVLLYRSPVSVYVAYQNLLPAFVGLFAVPWVVTNLLARVSIPPQHIARDLDVSWLHLAQGAAAGVLGGLFAAFLPVVTGGIGGFLAGHATAQRDDRTFLVAQGAAKTVYYVGGLLLFFVPGVHLTRGGMAWMISTQYAPYTPAQYFTATAGALAAGVLAFLLSLGLARAAIAAISRVSYRLISWVTLAILVLIVGGMTGAAGLAILCVATGIGLIPTLWGARRMNAMGVLLLPIALSMSGAGDAVARFLQLLP
ncbi:MAG: tripartite tricarboxylate transporter permease, partial [Anaerolineae bacterium]|nr:tripartite tricarboxylate transporter permease [Anaerolineae bacterium]